MRCLIAVCALALALVACGGGDPEPRETPEAGYTAGGTYDHEDYVGPAQQVTGHDHEPAEFGTRDKHKTERYCKTKKANGTCKTYGTKKVKDGVERYETDDADWYVVLEDGSRIDLDEATQARYPVGGLYP